MYAVVQNDGKYIIRTIAVAINKAKADDVFIATFKELTSALTAISCLCGVEKGLLSADEKLAEWRDLCAKYIVVDLDKAEKQVA